MSFVLGVILYAALVGALDARLPWPKSASQEVQS
jgi:hypothetical protein